MILHFEGCHKKSKVFGDFYVIYLTSSRLKERQRYNFTNLDITFVRCENWDVYFTKFKIKNLTKLSILNKFNQNSMSIRNLYSFEIKNKIKKYFCIPERCCFD